VKGIQRDQSAHAHRDLCRPAPDYVRSVLSTHLFYRQALISLISVRPPCVASSLSSVLAGNGSPESPCFFSVSASVEYPLSSTDAFSVVRISRGDWEISECNSIEGEIIAWWQFWKRVRHYLCWRPSVKECDSLLGSSSLRQ